jgi:hypothetical protein
MKKIFLILAFLSFSFGKIYSQCVGNCTLYTMSAIAYAPSPTVGTAVVLGDDQLSTACNIGFTFTFMCTARTQFLISSNGFITFDLAATNSGCCSGQPIPAIGSPDDQIAFDWNDLWPPGGGAITYTTIGTAPNRICIITYTNINHCCSVGPTNSGQIKLFETSNIIEIHSGVVTTDGSTATQGIENAAGTVAYAVAGRNGVGWTSNGDATRFSPALPLPNCSGTPTAGASAASPTSACAAYTTALSLVGSVQQCNITYQWQQAALIGGPYTNIAGATQSNVVVTQTASTTFYQCILTCGGQAVASTPVNCVIPPCSGTPTPGIAQASPTTGCLQANSNLLLTGTVAACGLTYQWQRALAVGGPYTNIAGAVTLTTNVTSTVTNWYRCIVSCGGNTAASAPAEVLITAGPCPSCTGQYYVRSNAGEPWGDNNNVTAMNAVFGATWTLAFYETVNVAAMLQPTTAFIFLEGGDFNANAMNTFVTTNIVAIQNWVASGGKLLMNAAPNQGGNMNWGFGGVTLNYPNFSTPGNAAIGQTGHPIFNGPNLPAGTAYTGTWWSHSTVTGGGIIDVITGTGGSTLAELAWGSGRVMFGGMTSVNWHSPVPNGLNLRKNIFVYLNCPPVLLPIEITEYVVDYRNEAANISWKTATEKNTDFFLLEKSIDGINYTFLDKLQAAGNASSQNKYSTTDREPVKNGTTYYRLKLYERGTQEVKFIEVKSLSLNQVKKTDLVLQPNPANSAIELSLPENFFNAKLTIQVIDYSGKEFMKVQVDRSSAKEMLNVETLKAGVYSIRVIDEKGKSVSRSFVKN